MLDALHYAHTVQSPDGQALGIVHRDISPSNVLIDVDGHVKIADFGVARMQGEQTEFKEGEGRDATVKGKFPYLAPEIFSGASPEASSDVYATAIVLDELIRGLNPFRSESAQITIGRVIHLVPESLHTVRDDVPKALAFVVAKALAKAPAERWANAEVFAAALRKAWPTPQDQSQRELAEAARRDFNDPSLAESLHVDDLSELARAWREAPEERDSLEFIPVAIDGDGMPITRQLSFPPTMPASPLAFSEGSSATTAATPLATVPSESAKSFRAAGFGLGALAIVAIAVVSVVVALRGSASGTGDRPVYLVVDRGAAPADDAGSPVALATDAQVGTAPPEVALVDAGLAPAARRPRAARASETASLEAPFRRRMSEIGRCFSAHSADLSGAPQLVVRFELDTNGSVTNSSLSPPELAGLPLGGCILGIARSTRFGPRSEAVSFRIPLGARRAP